jgi:hypothetical protein
MIILVPPILSNLVKEAPVLLCKYVCLLIA